MEDPTNVKQSTSDCVKIMAAISRQQNDQDDAKTDKITEGHLVTKLGDNPLAKSLRMQIRSIKDSGIGTTYISNGSSSAASTGSSSQSSSTHTSPETAVKEGESKKPVVNDDVSTVSTIESKKAVVEETDKDQQNDKTKLAEIIDITIASTEGPFESTPASSANKQQETAFSIRTLKLDLDQHESTPVRRPAGQQRQLAVIPLLKPIISSPQIGTTAMVKTVFEPVYPTDGEKASIPRLTTSPRQSEEATDESEVVKSGGGVRQRRLHTCEYCPKQFDRPSLLMRHVYTHTKEHPHVCRYCPKRFTTPSSRTIHERVHTKEKPYVCKVCNKCFAAGSNLIYHKLTHTQERRHSCPECQRGFITPGDLRRHMYQHTDQWPFRCSTCNKGFATSNQLQTHEHVHSKDKPHKCPICNRGYVQRSSLRAHLKIHGEQSQEPSTHQDDSSSTIRDDLQIPVSSSDSSRQPTPLTFADNIKIIPVNPAIDHSVASLCSTRTTTSSSAFAPLRTPLSLINHQGAPSNPNHMPVEPMRCSVTGDNLFPGPSYPILLNNEQQQYFPFYTQCTSSYSQHFNQPLTSTNASLPGMNQFNQPVAEYNNHPVPIDRTGEGLPSQPPHSSLPWTPIPSQSSQQWPSTGSAFHSLANFNTHFFDQRGEGQQTDFNSAPLNCCINNNDGTGAVLNFSTNNYAGQVCNEFGDNDFNADQPLDLSSGKNKFA